MASPNASAASFSFMASAITSLLLLLLLVLVSLVLVEDFLDFLPDGEAPPRMGSTACPNDTGDVMDATMPSTDHTAHTRNKDGIDDRFILACVVLCAYYFLRLLIQKNSALLLNWIALTKSG
jgi:hypothetical protein